MFDTTKADTIKFDSGLTYNEADIIVDAYLSTLEGLSAEGILRIMKNHLARAVRDSKTERNIISALAAEKLTANIG